MRAIVSGTFVAALAASAGCGRNAPPPAPVAAQAKPVDLVPEAPAAPTVVSGASFTCTIRGGGAVACFGGVEWGGAVLPGGDPDVGPFAIAGIDDAISLAGSANHACALRRSGAVACWGVNSGHVVTAGGTESAVTATATPVPGIDHGKQLAVSAYRACVVNADGGVQCWGQDPDAKGSARFTGPTAVAGLSGVTQVTIGTDFFCALAGGAVTCTGKHAPAFASKDIRALAAYTTFAAGLRATGDVVVAGMLQPYSAPNVPEQPFPELSPSSHLSSGDQLCVVSMDAHVRCFSNGVSSVNDIGASDVIEISAGGPHQCVRHRGGALACRGISSTLPVAGRADLVRHTPQPVVGLDHVVALGAGSERTCAVKSDGAVLCWGAVLASDPVGTPTAVAGVTGAKVVSVSENLSCSLGVDGHPVCWGLSQSMGRKFGDASAGALPELQDVKQMSLIESGGVACFLHRNGTVACRGVVVSGSTHQFDEKPMTLPVTGIAHATSVLASNFDGCAVVAAGTVSCWQFPRADLPKRDPIEGHAIDGVTGVVALAQLGSTYFALTKKGDLMTWNIVMGGAISKATLFDHVDNATLLAGGGDRLFVIAKGKVLAYDQGHYLRFSDESYGHPKKPPHEVAGIDDAAQVVAGRQHVCVRHATGTVSCWGLSTSGRLGDGTGVKEQTLALTDLRGL